MKILLANPRGFCAGVSRAIDVVEKVLELEKQPVYVRHEVVHNRVVVENLKAKGAIFVKEIDEVPDGAVCIFSAHGVAQAIVKGAEDKALKVYDATCPLVTKVHREVQQAGQNDAECVLIGHKGHPEVEGTLGQYHSRGGKIYLVETIEDVAKLEVKNPDNLVYATQTTLSVDETIDIIQALKAKYPSVHAPKKADICYATQNRQDAVKQMAQQIDVMLVVGSKNSSNSNRLRELSAQFGIDSYLLDKPEMLEVEWLQGKETCGITAGASAPEYVVQAVVSEIKKYYPDAVVEEFDGVKEEVMFPLPRLLKTKLKDQGTTK